MTPSQIIARIKEAGEVERSMPAPRRPSPMRSAHPPHEKTLQEAVDGLWALVRTDDAGQPVKGPDGTYLTDWAASWTRTAGADAAAIDRYAEVMAWLADLGRVNPKQRIAVWACYGQGWGPEMASTRMVVPLWRAGLIKQRAAPSRESVRAWRDGGVNWLTQHLVGKQRKSA